MTIYAGIDPGVSGAIVFIWPDGKIEFFDMPVTKVGGRSVYDVNALLAILKRLGQGYNELGLAPGFLTIEQLHAGMGGERSGKLAAFSLGYCSGMLATAAAALGIPHEFVSPNRWKKGKADGLLRDMPDDKGASVVVAKRLFPDAAPELTSKKSGGLVGRADLLHGRADALLLAEYGRRLK